MNNKAIKFQEYLINNNITAFNQKELQDNINTVVFNTKMVVKGQELQVLVILDDSIYTMISVQIAVDVERTAELIEFLNELNLKYKSYTFYLTKENNIMLDSCIIGRDDDKSELIMVILNNIMKQLPEEYIKIMRIIWNK